MKSLSISLILILVVVFNLPQNVQAQAVHPKNFDTNFTKKVLTLLLQHTATYYWNQTSDKTLQLNQKTYGQYQCGIFEVLYHEKLQKNLLKMMGYTWKKPKRSTLKSNYLKPWQVLLGTTPLEAKFADQKGQGRFLHLSQQALTQISQIDFNPQDQIFNQSLQNLYDHIFRDSIRVFASAHLYLAETQKIEFEAQAYFNQMMTSATFYAPTYLHRRFQNLSLDPVDQQFQWCESLTRSMGFWIRRHIDGSRLILWQTMSRLLNKFDPGWIEKHKKQIQKITHTTPHDSFALSEAQRIKIASAILAKLSKYKFKGYGKEGQVSIQNKKLSWFMGGPFELLGYDQSLFVTIAQQIDIYHQLPPKDLIKKIAGVSLEQPYREEEVKRPFTFINPQFIQWFHDQMIPQPQSRIWGYSAKHIYQYIFKKSTHTLVHAYLFLLKTGGVQKHQLEYSLALMSPQAHGGRYLLQKYAILNEQYSELKGYQLSMPKAVGFWLRRGIDQSAPMIWAALQSFLKQFDPEMSEYIQRKLDTH